jgi:CheY-like chemotaxis protein
MKKALSTLDISRMLGVAVASVAKWIDENQLNAGKTPGGHRRVQVEDLLIFLKRQNLPIPPELLPECRVLVVDDEESVSGWVADEVKAEFPACEVYQANDGFAAGELVASLKPAAVILDLRMPGLDGYEVCKRIKSRKDAQATVVIAMTGQPSPKAEKRILECGAKVCLSKPLDREMLMKEVALAVKR